MSRPAGGSGTTLDGGRTEIAGGRTVEELCATVHLVSNRLGAAAEGIAPQRRQFDAARRLRFRRAPLLSRVATLGECPARGARLSLRPSNEGITLELLRPADGQLLPHVTLGWSEIE